MLSNQGLTATSLALFLLPPSPCLVTPGRMVTVVIVALVHDAIQLNTILSTSGVPAIWILETGKQTAAITVAGGRSRTHSKGG